MAKGIFTDLTEDEVAYLYTLLKEEVTNYDCGSLCKDDNGGVPFCCVTENAVPLLYKKNLNFSSQDPIYGKSGIQLIRKKENF